VKATKVRLKPKDSFDLIRLLAETQSDPRKAIAELAQNSLDAGAKDIEILWFNEKGRRAIRVLDDGGGIFPELEREAALKKIATTIGHSHKRDLDLATRREMMMLGQYGIGLLGFWSLGEQMEIRSRVGGGRPHSLVLQRGKRQANIQPVRATRLDDADTYTSITIRELHGTAMRQVRPGKIHPYLSRELRGQLLGRDVSLRIRDKVARGRARKLWRVVAEPFLGRRLERFTELAVAGHEPAKLELYFVPADEEREGRVQLACGGATVLDDVAELERRDSVWTSGRFEGVVDFGALRVAPGTRRGVVPDNACLALMVALDGLARELEGFLDEERARREEERDRNVAREIRRVFRSVARLLPEYDLFDVKDGERGRGEDEPPSEGEPVEAPAETEGGEEEPPALYPPGPLAAVRIRPAHARVAPGTGRAFTAVAEDADGRCIREGVEYAWALEGRGALHGDGGKAEFEAPESDGEAALRVEATQGDVAVSAEASITIEESLADRLGGIPEPVAIHAPSESWRSRVAGSEWQYNAGHRDYRAVADVQARRIRYLTHLFAKELVVRNFGRPADAEILERLVELLTYLR